MKPRVSIESRHTCPWKLRQGSSEGTSPRSRCVSRTCVLISATYAYAAAARQEAVPDVGDATFVGPIRNTDVRVDRSGPRTLSAPRDETHASQHLIKSDMSGATHMAPIVQSQQPVIEMGGASGKGR